MVRLINLLMQVIVTSEGIKTIGDHPKSKNATETTELLLFVFIQLILVWNTIEIMSLCGIHMICLQARVKVPPPTQKQGKVALN